MKKLILLTCVFAFMLSNIAMASDTRLETMGMGNFILNESTYPSPNSIIKDDANISLYPSTVNYYPGLFFAEVSDEYDDDFTVSGYSRVFYKAGVLYQLGDPDENPWVLGAHFSTIPYYHSIHGYYNDGGIYATNHRLNLYYGREISGMPFGFNFGYYSSSDKNEDTTMANNDEDALSRYEFTLGLSPMSGQLDIAVGMAMTSWTDLDYYNNGVDSGLVDFTKPDGNMDLFLRARYWMNPWGKYTLVPHLAFISSKQGREDYSYVSINLNPPAWQKYHTQKYSQTTIDLGIGVNYDAATDVLVATDFGVAFNSFNMKSEYEDTSATDTELKMNFNVFPYFRIGIDAQVFEWMDFRAGIVAAWNKYKYENDWNEDDRSETYTLSETFLGAGFHWGNLEIDASVDPEFLLHGPYFIGGEPTDNNYSGMYGKVSISYWFDK